VARGNRFDLYQDLTINGVERDGTEVTARVLDTAMVDHWIRFRFEQPGAADAHEAALLAWQVAGTRLTYVRADKRGLLVDDEELFHRAYGDEPSHW
jgi:hypothetical protein